MTKPRKATPEDLARVEQIRRSARAGADEQDDDGAQQSAETSTVRDDGMDRASGPTSDT